LKGRARRARKKLKPTDAAESNKTKTNTGIASTATRSKATVATQKKSMTKSTAVERPPIATKETVRWIVQHIAVFESLFILSLHSLFIFQQRKGVATRSQALGLVMENAATTPRSTVRSIERCLSVIFIISLPSDILLFYFDSVLAP
jgi:hypothetical protein